MVQAKELRIGNYVYCFDKQTEIDLVHFRDLYEGIDEEGWYKPIPLTEEWLLKFGFEKKDINKHYRHWKRSDIDFFTLSGFCINKYSNYLVIGHYWGGTFSLTQRQGLKIQYVHQLQNLYFALCGEELTIKEELNTLNKE
jgi:hypothetical protein